MAAFTLLVLAAWLLPSFFSAESYRRRLEAGLERALDRQVTFGAVSFRLLPHPGFSIENAVVREDPAFGAEPFARVERIDCDLSWRGLLHSRLDFARLYLERPSLNLVRNSQGEWNVGTLLYRTKLASPRAPSAASGAPRRNLDLEADEARIDFKVGADKKPFALTDVQARISFDRQRGFLQFRVAGNPIRTDLSLPSPGLVQLEGKWTPGTNLEGPLDAELRTQGALLYDWVPLLSGRNPQLNGIVDAQLHLTGSLHHVALDGQTQVSQLHRAEQPPPSDPMPATFLFRAYFDRTSGRVTLESLDGTFADSQLHLTGTLDKLPSAPDLDLVMAVERSRLEDFLALASRISGHAFSFGVTGRVDGLVSVQGPWEAHRFGGFISASTVHLVMPTASYAVSDAALRIANGIAKSDPFRLEIAPHVNLTVEGAIGNLPTGALPSRSRGKKLNDADQEPPRYEVSLEAKGAPLQDLIRFARALGILTAQGVDARGWTTGSLTLSGSAHPFERPSVRGLADLRAARLLVPGFTEPINLPRAHIEAKDSRIVADSIVAVLGTSVFTGRLEHQGDRKQPWIFDLKANALSLEQGSLWFDALGRRQPLPLLERLPGLLSFGEVRVAASNYFSALHARGNFSSPLVTYHGVSLEDFKSSVEIGGRQVRLSDASFRAAGGRGKGMAEINLAGSPAQFMIQVALADGQLSRLTPFLPTALGRLRGALSGEGTFETRGLSHEELRDNLTGHAALRLKRISLGDFDPLQNLVQQAWGSSLEPARGEIAVRSSLATLQVRDRQVRVDESPLELAGAKLKARGVYDFGGASELEVSADLRHLSRRWLDGKMAPDSNARTINLHLAGPLRRLTVAPQVAASRLSPPAAHR